MFAPQLEEFKMVVITEAYTQMCVPQGISSWETTV